MVYLVNVSNIEGQIGGGDLGEMATREYTWFPLVSRLAITDIQ